MDGPREYHTKWNMSEKDKYYMISLHVESKKWYKWTYLQNRNRHTDIENKFTVTKGKREVRRDKLGIWYQQIKATVDKIDKLQGFTV